MENMRHSVEALKIVHENSPSNGIVTISLGGTSMVPAEGIGASKLIRDADLNLYEAKGGGRNRSVI
jgi:two-component system chemotaxis family response regulator WspR